MQQINQNHQFCIYVVFITLNDYLMCQGYNIFHLEQQNMTKKQKISRDEDPAYKPYERDDLKKRKRSSMAKLNSFTWSTAQEILYVEFLKNNKELFIDVKQRKKNKVFVSMSLYLKKRGPDQCRSHHQKMSIKYGDIDQIVKRITQDKISKGLVDQPQQNSTNEQKIKENQQIQMEQQKQYEIKYKEDDSVFVESPQVFLKQEDQLWDYLDQGAWIGY